jgi:hypothetical protein
LHVATGIEEYELLIGTTTPSSLAVDEPNLVFVGRLLDIVFHHFAELVTSESASRLTAAAEPARDSLDDLQTWLITQLLDAAYPGSMCEISELAPDGKQVRLLASSVTRPWEPSPWAAPKNLEMLAGYVSRIGVPLVVPSVEPPFSAVIESVEAQMRFLRARSADASAPASFSAMALPIISSTGNNIGALYMLLPRAAQAQLDVEVRVLAILSGIVGETLDRRRAALHAAELASRVATRSVLKREEFRAALVKLLTRSASALNEPEALERDVRLPFLLLSAHRPSPVELDPATSTPLRDWLVETLNHLEWRSFLRSHYGADAADLGTEGFIGELPGVGVMIALGSLVSKDELDLIRSAFPESINRTMPSNAPVRLLAWVVDVPGHRIVQAAKDETQQDLADAIERWAFDITAVIDDVASSSFLVNDGEWDAALRRTRRALLKPGGKKNGYLHRLSATCSFALGDWPNAMQHARKAVSLSKENLGSGLVRSMCQQADAHLFLVDPVRAFDLYTEAESAAVSHPLPRYYRGQALLLIARLIDAFEREQPGAALSPERPDAARGARTVLGMLVNGALADLTAAADLLDRWGLIPESYQYRNFHLISTFVGQGTAYLLSRQHGPAASRLQSARRSFPKDDLLFREYAFAKCMEQGVHRQYAALASGARWTPMQERLLAAFERAV